MGMILVTASVAVFVWAVVGLIRPTWARLPSSRCSLPPGARDSRTRSATSVTAMARLRETRARPRFAATAVRRLLTAGAGSAPGRAPMLAKPAEPLDDSRVTAGSRAHAGVP